MIKHIFTKQALLESFPAYDIFEREETSKGYIEITCEDTLGVKHPKGFYRTYSPGSAASYALAYNECPIESVAEAKARGHATHWINQNATCITSHAQAKRTVIAVRHGQKVRFEGLIATIEADHNNNLKFVPVQL